ncbi:MAG: autotransporter assembly complex family protein [Pseudomonadales bacterium]
MATAVAVLPGFGIQPLYAQANAAADKKARQPVTLKVQVEGLDGRLDSMLAANITLFLNIATLAAEAKPSRDKATRAAALKPSQIRRAHRRAPDQIRQALMPFGYYQPTIESELEEVAGVYAARYRVAPGPAVVIESVTVVLQGAIAALPLAEQLRSRYPIAPGEQLSHGRYDSAKQDLLDQVYAAGFLDARFATAQLAVRPDARLADIHLLLDSGPRYLFGDVEIEQGILNEQFVARFNSIEAGEPFDATRLIDLQLRLTDADYFNTVVINADKSSAVDQRVPVRIVTTPKKSQRYSVGLGYGTDTGPRAKVSTEHRRINRRGHQFNADLQTSAVRNTLAAEYRVPFKNVARDRYRFFARVEQADVGDAETDQFSIGAQREEDWLGLRRQLYLKYDGENFSFGDGPTQQSRLLIAGAALSYQRADDALFSRKGVSVTLDVHGAVDSLASETTFIQSTLGARAVWPLGQRSRLLLRGEAGVTEADEFLLLPPAERFFTGGDRSVRGYAFQSLSPENAVGDNIGGSYLSVVSVEVDRLLRGNIGLAAFYDYGGAGDRFGDRLRGGFGVGLRYRSPVGMIRIDLAHPLDDDGTNFRLHLSLGPDL